ncbi:AAA family ATPase [Rubeoparvulum massiliense]|uniref:AAA family ATPase n=1 Tax=Rubeoparvulum massiliense TaxID=1631346 RepID=UPI00065DBEF3|nr:AAA family ATPase [Rubeoparvulum massiliense]
MRIETMKLYGFGQFQDLELTCKPGLNLILGTNEAGKSTLMAFIRAMFYGFPTKKQLAQRYEPWEASTLGGRLSLYEDGVGSFLLERLYKQRSAGDLLLHRPDGTVGGEEDLRRLLAPINETIFKNLYAFGLWELQTMETLQPEEIHSFLYHTTAGNGAQLLQLKQQLQTEAEQLYKAGSKKGELTELRRQLQQITTEILQLQGETERYEGLLSQQEELTEQLGIMRTQQVKLTRQQQWLAILAQGEKLYAQGQLVKEQLAQLPLVEYFPSDGLERLERYLERHTQTKIRLDTIQKQIEEKMQQLLTFTNRDGWEGVLAQQEELQSGWIRYQERLERNTIDEQTLQQTTKQLNDLLQSIGEDWEVEQISAFQLDMPTRQWVKDWQEEERQRQQKIVQWETSRSHTHQRLHVVKQRLLQTSERNQPINTEATQLKSRIQQLQQLQLQKERKEGELIQLTRERELLQSNRIGSKRRKSSSPLLIIGGLAATGLAVYFFMIQQYLWTGITFTGFLLIGGASWYQEKSLKEEAEVWEQKEVQRLTFLMKEEESCRREIQRMEKEANTLLQRYGKTSLAQLEEEWEQLQQQHSQQQQVELERARMELDAATLQGELESVDQKLQEVLTHQTEQLEAWKGWLQVHHIPLDWTPAMVEELIRIADRMHPLIRKQEELQESIQQAKQQLEQWRSHIIQLMEQTGRELVQTPTQQEIKQWFQEMKDVEEQMQQLRQIEEQLLKWQEEEQQLLAEEALVHQQLQHLYEEVGASNEAEYRKRGEYYRLRQSLQHELLSNTTLLRQLVQDQAEYEQLIQDLQDGSVQQRMEQEAELAETSKSLQMQLDQHQQERGQITQQLKELATSTRLLTALQRKEELRAQAAERINRWCRLRLGRLAIEKAMELYEQEKQPEVLQWASRYFSQMTAGRYPKVFMPLEGETICVERADGRKIEPAYLSRGTVEQLYLAIRFALIEMYGKEKRIPLVFDDILVNFDPERSKKTLFTIGQLAKQQQVFFFTCHPSLVDQVHELGLPMNIMELSKHTFTVIHA